MFETLDKLILAGLGAISMTRERAEKIFDEYVSRGQVEKEKRSGFVKELMEHAEKTRNDLEKLVSDQVQKTVKQLNLATREDIEQVKAKLEQLLKKR